MINKKVIDTLYKRYPKRPKSTDQLNIALLFEGLHPFHGIEIDEDIVINSVDMYSPFHRIPLKHVHEIVEFDDYVAIVLDSSIVFLTKNESENPVSVHLKPYKPSIKDRLLSFFGKGSLPIACCF